MPEIWPFYRRRLPHIQPARGIFFVTFRLAGSLPQEVIVRLKEEKLRDEMLIRNIKDEELCRAKLTILRKRYFGKFDEILDLAATGPLWLNDERVARMVADAIRGHDGKNYGLITYTIMPNHVHLVFEVARDSSRDQDQIHQFDSGSKTKHYVVTNILRLLKGATAREASKLLHLENTFWQHESFDHLVRDEEELKRIIEYVLNNPVKAGLVKNWKDWKWTYLAGGDSSRRSKKQSK